MLRTDDEPPRGESGLRGENGFRSNTNEAAGNEAAGNEAAGNDPEIQLPTSTSGDTTMAPTPPRRPRRNKPATEAGVGAVAVPAAVSMGSQPATAQNQQGTQRGLRRTADEWQAKLEAGRTQRQASVQGGPAITPLRGLAKNRAQTMNAAPTRGLREENPPQRRGPAITPLRGLAKNRAQAIYAAPNRGLMEESPLQRASQNEGSSLSLPYLEESSEVASEDNVEEISTNTPGLSPPETDPPTQISPSRPSAPTRGDSGLAVALPVQDDAASLMEAQEIDHEDLQRKELKEQKRRECRWVGCAIIAACCTAMALALGFTLGKKDGTPTTVAPSLAPTGAPSSAPSGALDILLQDLPAYTLEALKNISTPQWKAQDWLSRHPELPGLEEWRKKQLFALVSFFFAMEGPNWPKPIQERWLQYGVDECYWFTSSFGGFTELGTYEEDFFFNATPCDAIGDFKHLILDDLDLSGHQPVLPPEITFLSSLKSLVVESSGINASIAQFMPSEIFQLTNLKLFNMVGNSLQGSIPTEFGALTGLSALVLEGNSLSGEIPSELSLLPYIRSLYLSDNQITGMIPSALGIMTSLTSLSLSKNHLTGPIPSELALLSDLTYLDLWGNHLTGPIPTELGLVAHNPWYDWYGWTLKRKLEYLSLASNVLTGTIPTELGLLTHMTGLRLWGNSLTGAIPTEFGMLSSLEEMQLAANHLSGKIPSELGLISNMTTLLLAENYLTGTIPTELGMLSNMTGFYLYGTRNTLSGTIPTEIGLMNSMTELYLYRNALTGTIPTEMGLMTLTTELSLSTNTLTGTIPTEIGLMTSMTDIRLSNNGLTGRIPTELGLLLSLSLGYALLHNNSLTGTIPQEVNALAINGSLAILTIKDNDLSGEASEELCSIGMFNRSAVILGLAPPIGVSFDCNEKFCGCEWCPCVGYAMVEGGNGTESEGLLISVNVSGGSGG